jgi:uncharacterized protein involved in exopolysaccharide biosynthesis
MQESNYNQQHPPYQQPYMQEDEIDLRELFSTIWKNKWKLLFTSILITSLALIYALITPNSYSSKTILLMKEQSKSSVSGGAAALAAMAGVNLGGGGGGLDITSMFKNLIDDFSFNNYVIRKYHLVERLSPEGMQKNLVYVLNGERMAIDIKNFFKSSKEDELKSEEDLIFETFKILKTIISTSTDKESGAITLSVTHKDRFLAKELVDIYLKEMSNYIKVLDMKEIAEQEAYYNNELDQASSIELKQNLADLLSALMKKKVLSQVGEYYMVKQLTKSKVAYIKDKTKPKRGLIIVVAFITSIILGIFMIFFGEFLRNKDEDEIIEEIEVIKEDKSRNSEISF